MTKSRKTTIEPVAHIVAYYQHVHACEAYGIVRSVRIVVLAGKTFRSTYHFEDTKYTVSPNWAKDAINAGIAILDLG